MLAILLPVYVDVASGQGVNRIVDDTKTALVRIQMTVTDLGGFPIRSGHGHGVLISQEVLLTALHNIIPVRDPATEIDYTIAVWKYDKPGSSRISDQSYLGGFNSLSVLDRASFLPVVETTPCSTQSKSVCLGRVPADSHDFALFSLDQTSGNWVELHGIWDPIDEESQNYLLTRKFNQGAVDKFELADFRHVENGEVYSTLMNAVVHEAPFDPGVSGSPIVSVDTSGISVLAGIVVTSKGGTNQTYANIVPVNYIIQRFLDEGDQGRESVKPLVPTSSSSYWDCSKQHYKRHPGPNPLLRDYLNAFQSTPSYLTISSFAECLRKLSTWKGSHRELVRTYARNHARQIEELYFATTCNSSSVGCKELSLRDSEIAQTAEQMRRNSSDINRIRTQIAGNDERTAELEQRLASANNVLVGAVPVGGQTPLTQQIEGLARERDLLESDLRQLSKRSSYLREALIEGQHVRERIHSLIESVEAISASSKLSNAEYLELSISDTNEVKRLIDALQAIDVAVAEKVE